MMQRLSRARPSDGGSRASNVSTGSATPASASSSSRPQPALLDLPDYERPQYPLNAKAQRALAQLIREHKLESLELDLKESNTFLANFAGDINEKLAKKEDYVGFLKRKKRKRLAMSQRTAGQDDGDMNSDEETARAEIEQLESELKAYEEKVKSLTQTMDTQVIRNIDGLQNINDIKAVIDHVSARAGVAALRSQQMQDASRSQRQQRNDNSDDDDTRMTNASLGFEPTNDGATSRSQDIGPGPGELYSQKLREKEAQYQNLTRATRYAHHNEYAAFRKAVHEARYSYTDEPPALPPAKRWFPEKGSPAPGTANGPGSDSDEDVQIARERVSTKCPLTLRELEDPLSSKKCPHAFDRTAILEFINSSRNAIGSGRGAQKVIQCPVPGCSAYLTPADLHEDVALIRRIKRIQEAKRRAEQEDEDSIGSADDTPVTGSSRPQRDGMTMNKSVLLQSSPRGSGADDGLDISDVAMEDEEESGRPLETPRSERHVPLRDDVTPNSTRRFQPPRSSAVTDIVSLDEDENEEEDQDDEDEE